MARFEPINQDRAPIVYVDGKRVDYVDGGVDVPDAAVERLSAVTTLRQVEEKVVDKPTTRSTVPELKAYAEKNGIDLGAAKTKPDILAAIQKAETPPEPPTGGEGEGGDTGEGDGADDESEQD